MADWLKPCQHICVALAAPHWTETTLDPDVGKKLQCASATVWKNKCYILKSCCLDVQIFRQIISLGEVITCGLHQSLASSQPNTLVCVPFFSGIGVEDVRICKQDGYFGQSCFTDLLFKFPQFFVFNLLLQTAYSKMSCTL